MRIQGFTQKVYNIMKITPENSGVVFISQIGIYGGDEIFIT